MDEANLYSDEKSQVVFGIRLGKNLSIFLVCLALTTVFWLLNAFTKDYSTNLYFPLRYENLPENQVVVNELPRFLTVEVNGFGFKLLSFYLFGSLDSLSVDYEKGIQKHRVYGGLSIVPKSELKKLAKTEIPNDIKIEGLNIDSLRIATDHITTKSIFIQPNVDYTVAQQCYLKDSISVTPNQCVLSGPTSLLNKMQFISTKKMALKDLDKSVAMDVELEFPKNFSSVTKQVRLRVPVDKATEKELIVPIRVTGDTSNSEIKLFPNTVEIKVKVGLSDYDKLVANQFTVVVDAQHINEAKKYLPVLVKRSPKFAEPISISPKRVEYIIKK